MNLSLCRYSLLISLLWIFSAGKANSGRLQGEISDGVGRSLANAVVVAMPVNGLTSDTAVSPLAETLDQRNREFIPHVLVVRSGTAVNFPNNDKIRHHVYSFSPAKRFEIKLYKDTPPNPIHFDIPGIAVLGCNIHDWMISYVYITDSPYFTKSDNLGHWSLDVPSADYKIQIWQPNMEEHQQFGDETVHVPQTETIVVNRSINIKRSSRTGKPPASLQAEVYKGEP